MKSSTTHLLYLSVLICFCSCGRSTVEVDKQAVRNCFKEYTAAVVNKNGEAAVKMISTKTRDYYTGILSLALKGSEPEVRSLRPIVMMAVLNARHSINPNELRRMTVDDLLIFGTNQRWIGKEGVKDLTIGEVSIFGDRAVGKVLDEGRETALSYTFLREHGGWKLDLVSHFDQFDQNLRSLAQTRNVSVMELIFANLEAINGKKVSEDIWKPANGQ